MPRLPAAKGTPFVRYLMFLAAIGVLHRVTVTASLLAHPASPYNRAPRRIPSAPKIIVNERTQQRTGTHRSVHTQQSCTCTYIYLYELLCWRHGDIYRGVEGGLYADPSHSGTFFL